MKKHVIVVAGGKGLRMGSKTPKQFLEIAGKTIIIHTLEKIKKALPMAELFLVLPETEIDRWNDISDGTDFQEIKVANGGVTRFDSVKAGLALINSDGIVGIHDAVRPFASIQTIRAAFAEAEESGAAIPVVEQRDSLRKLEGNTSLAVDRSEYKVVQTPQCFRLELLIKAYQQQFSKKFTDDASVVESNGFGITLVEGNDSNIKITTKKDLKLAEYLLEEND